MCNFFNKQEDRWVSLRLFVRASALVFISILVFSCASASGSVVSIALNDKLGQGGASGIESWTYTKSNRPGLGAVISKGSRANTKKVARTINYIVRSNSGGVKLNFVTRNVIRYEVYMSGPLTGQIYRVYKPSSKKVSASARYLSVFKLTVSLKSTVGSVVKSADGSRGYSVVHKVKLTLPRQFPLKRDQLSEMLRRMFNIEFENYSRSYTIVPDNSYGKVRVDLAQ